MISTPQDKKKVITNILNITITPARCSVYLKKSLNNTELEAKQKALKQKLVDIQDVEEINTIKSELTSISKQIIRTTSEVPAIIAVLCNNFITELIKNTFTDAVNSNNTKKNIDINFIKSCMKPDNMYYSFYYKAPSVLNYNPELYKTVKKVSNKNAANAETTTTSSSGDEKPDPEIQTKKTSKNEIAFVTFVDNIIKPFKQMDEYKEKVKINSEVKLFLSNLIIDFINRFITLSKIIARDIIGSRTININYIKAIVHMFMKDDNIDDEKIEHVTSTIDQSLDTFHQYYKNEKDNKINSMTDEKKEENKKKQVEKVKNRKKKELEAAEKKIHDTAEKIKKLSEELVE
jgi:hypothetical protein